MKLLIENQIFPVVNFYYYSFNYKHMLLSSCEWYQKRSFRNRYLVAGSNGVVPLSVPLENGRNQKARFKDIRISYDTNWQKVHWRTLTSCYNKSPFFLEYADKVESFFTRNWKFLFDLNLSILHWLHKALKHPAELVVMDSLNIENDFPGATDLTNRWMPNNFQREPNGLVYPQVFEERIGFQNNLSILDLLFNTGPMAGVILSRASLREEQK